MIRVAFDIGGVLSKYPDTWRPVVQCLLDYGQAFNVEVWILSDMKPHHKAVAFCHENGFVVPPERVVCRDYETGGELCKAFSCQEHAIDILIDEGRGTRQ